MNYAYKIATLNNNAISSQMKIKMLTNFLLSQDIDIALLQEVANNDLSIIYGYSAHINEGTEERGTAILMKEGISVNNIKKLPSGRGITGLFEGTWLINVYAPSGAEKRHERENFFTNELAYLLPTGPKEILLAGDFKCVITPADCTGSPNLSKALSATLAGLPLHDAWEQASKLLQYTNSGATRIDRIYLTDQLKTRKQGAETIIAPFSDHLAVAVPLTYSHQTNLRKRRLWEMNISLLDDNIFCDSLMLLWCNWKRNMKYYPNAVLWWNRKVKQRIRQTLQREEASRNRDKKDMEGHGRFLLYSNLPHTTIPSTYIRESRYCGTMSKSENITSPKQNYERDIIGYRRHRCSSK